MNQSSLPYAGPPIDDEGILEVLPESLVALVREVNGFIKYEGGLHVRGASLEPNWHSLREAWIGDLSFQRLYPRVINSEDLPFAEDCFGDQFFLRHEIVWRLAAETGDVEPLELSVAEFLQAAEADPVEFLSLQPLIRFQNEVGQLAPGMLLSAFPPYCIKTTGKAVDLRAIASLERRKFLADFAAQIADLPDGASVRFDITDGQHS
ncbi:MAG: SMI1/KNR4 family protein [Planctomycetota bacterium]|nr:SMI1/KNR4 family protein [Planctomycetaceae bacterium]MDQ3329869.1 SMI1/KNR4 family protein [Planctomycetota bacterium]